ncbi:MAG: hypothetical protein VXX85_00850, partial [Candidatus Margulisiibacteriota bacterium]|nr:hypothetical protein [Candidatus Margulisiibacteriota bacterium]
INSPLSLYFLGFYIPCISQLDSYKKADSPHIYLLEQSLKLSNVKVLNLPGVSLDASFFNTRSINSESLIKLKKQFDCMTLMDQVVNEWDLNKSILMKPPSKLLTKNEFVIIFCDTIEQIHQINSYLLENNFGGIILSLELVEPSSENNIQIIHTASRSIQLVFNIITALDKQINSTTVLFYWDLELLQRIASNKEAQTLFVEFDGEKASLFSGVRNALQQKTTIPNIIFKFATLAGFRLNKQDLNLTDVQSICTSLMQVSKRSLIKRMDDQSLHSIEFSIQLLTTLTFNTFFELLIKKQIHNELSVDQYEGITDLLLLKEPIEDQQLIQAMFKEFIFGYKQLQPMGINYEQIKLG